MIVFSIDESAKQGRLGPEQNFGCWKIPELPGNDNLNQILDINNPGGVLGLMFAGYVPLASQSPHPILVYFLANYRPHLSHFLENVIFAIPT